MATTTEIWRLEWLRVATLPSSPTTTAHAFAESETFAADRIAQAVPQPPAPSPADRGRLIAYLATARDLAGLRDALDDWVA